MYISKQTSLESRPWMGQNFSQLFRKICPKLVWMPNKSPANHYDRNSHRSIIWRRKKQSLFLNHVNTCHLNTTRIQIIFFNAYPFHWRTLIWFIWFRMESILLRAVECRTFRFQWNVQINVPPFLLQVDSQSNW